MLAIVESTRSRPSAMPALRNQRLFSTRAAFVASLLVLGWHIPHWHASAQTSDNSQKAAPPASKAEKRPTSAAKGDQAIVVLVNDEPVTAYQIEQRARFLALNTN